MAAGASAFLVGALVKTVTEPSATESGFKEPIGKGGSAIVADAAERTSSQRDAQIFAE